MDLNPVIALVVGIAIRFGIPIIVTALLVWGLRKLDAQWQSEATEKVAQLQRLSTNGRKPCWKIRNCPPKEREGCPAYMQKSLIPCWQIFRNGRGELRESCLDCEVFRGTPTVMAA
jgi:hypothetical protein